MTVFSMSILSIEMKAVSPERAWIDTSHLMRIFFFLAFPCVFFVKISPSFAETPKFPGTRRSGAASSLRIACLTRCHQQQDIVRGKCNGIPTKVQSLEGSSLQTIRVNKCREFIPAVPLVPYELWWLLFLQPTQICPFFVLAPEILTTILNRFKSPRLLESSAQAPRWHQQRFVGWEASMYVAALSSSVLSLLRTVRASIIIFLPPRLLLLRSILVLPSRRTAARQRRIFSVRYWCTRPARYSPSSTTLEV